LVRFETSGELSKYAALMVMNQGERIAQENRLDTAETLINAVSLSKRSGAQWVKAFALTLKDPQASLAQWEQITQHEEDTYTQFPDQSSSEIVRDLLRWQASLLRRLKHEEQAVAVIRRTVDLLDGTVQQLLDAVDWLIEYKILIVVDDVAKRFPEIFENDHRLLYSWAESQALRNQPELAKQTADSALKLNPKKPQAHIEAGRLLTNRGLFDWAEHEYRFVIQLGPLGSRPEQFARSLLSEMLHDQFQDLAAAKVLQETVDAMDNDPNILQTIKEQLKLYQRTPEEIHSRMHNDTTVCTDQTRIREIH